jgi:YgiT-type zinc finger domain-containing protein
MECAHCRGQLQRGSAPFSIDRKGYQIHWNAIPAWVCSQCGEPTCEAKEVEAIQGVLSLVDERSLELTSAA